MVTPLMQTFGLSESSPRGWPVGRPVQGQRCRSAPKVSLCSNRPYVHSVRGPSVRVGAESSNGSAAVHLTSFEDLSRIYINDKGILVDSAAEPPFTKMMAANRGEIATRIVRAGVELGLQTVAIYSSADRLSPHRFKADESYQVGSADATPVGCYLDIESIIKVAKKHGVDVIHPGYGFLSENAQFAKRCGEEGITFIGPLPETIQRMGDKTEARRAAQECGVPVVPGTDDPFEHVAAAKEFADKAGYPVMLKAAMGGGGRGMRIVRSADELEEAFNRASSEATSAFGDGRMFVEKYVEDPRHIEIQILADHYGNVIHLWERDCSVQRRHQKVVEIAPAMGLDPVIRNKLLEDAVKLAKHVGYRNAGTVEFMVDKNGAYYFLEVNPRLQVEHTVTEQITGADIVHLQVLVAGGAKLSELGYASQADVPPPQGVAMQCRITSEDPERNFQPDTGRIGVYRSPGGPGVRLDGMMTAGAYVSPHYDSLLVKVITHATTYYGAIQRMQRALFEFQIRGVKTNILFLENVLRHPEFLSGTATTSFIERNATLFHFNSSTAQQSSKLLTYLSEQVVNGPNHPGATGPPPPALYPVPPAVPAGPPPPGWRQILVEQGPEAWAKAVREHPGVLLTDTTWRDAHQSLLATRVRTADLLKAAPATSHLLAPLGSLEMWGGATFDVALRFLHECPWRRLELLREAVPNIPFQMLFRGANAVGYTAYPDNVVEAFVAEAKTSGIDIFRVFDCLNDVDNLRFGIDSVRKVGGVAEGTLCYSGDITDPTKTKYTLDYYLGLARELVDHGVHSLAIKDMAGVLKPRAAELLVTALRKEFPTTVIHVHTHDSAATGVATQLAAAAAGADIVDVCLDSMSGTTSQPAMGAIVNALRGTSLDTGLHPDSVTAMDAFWEKTRLLYSPFETGLKTSSSEVYNHAMPGGQYSNLKMQASSLGLGEEWDKVQKAYAAANRALGDIIKVTPSSKVCGDLAQFMVQNNLDEHQLVEQADKLSLPTSVVEFLQGFLGHPVGGFPEPLRSKVVGNKPNVTGRPGASLAPLNLQDMHTRLRDKWEGQTISYQDVLSAAMYPKVFDEYKAFAVSYSHFTEQLPTHAFFAPLGIDEEVELEITQGVSLAIKLKAVGELQPSGIREVFFETNGIPRVVDVVDKKVAKQLGRAARDKADPTALGSCGAPMAGQVVEVLAKPGVFVSAGSSLIVMSAMKMECTVSAPCSGTVQHVAVVKGDAVDAGDLLVRIQEEDTGLSSIDDSTMSSLDSAQEDAAVGRRVRKVASAA